MGYEYDFSGWATKNDLRCADGRTIRRNAFKECDGVEVPLVWNHAHNEPENVLGHALLENRDDGVYCYGTFNDTSSGQVAKVLVQHGDIKALSIYANQLKQISGDVVHGIIREVSLVHAGANPEAMIDTVIAHSDDNDEEAIIYTGEPLFLMHSDEKSESKPSEAKEDSNEKGDSKVANEKETNNEKTVKEIFDEFTDDQKKVVYAIVGQAVADAKGETDDEDEEDTEEMKHNVFENDAMQQDNYLSHADVQNIFENAKRMGSLKAAVEDAIESGVIAHSIDTTDMDTATGTQTYGFNDPSMLFPNAKSLNTPPEWISRNMDWVSDVMGGVKHTPFTRIKSVFADITEDEARARGYVKGTQKVHEVFATLKRETTPQTIYKLQKMDRDDIIDITDFDVVAWIRNEMRLMLNEEIARAILIGDGRVAGTSGKINETNIRPVVTDVPLFNTKINVAIAANDDENAEAKKIINAIIRARKNYKGSGNPTFYTTEDVLTELLLLEDQIGHKLYKTEAELATALRVRKIVTVEPMEGMKVDNKDLIGVIVNLADYNVGADKGGEVNMFDDFDINFNQYSYLIETRCSGALIKPYSALTILKTVGSGE